MRAVRCENGHFFDLEKGTVCPRCGSNEYTLTGMKETPVVQDKKALKAQEKLKKAEAKLREKENKLKLKAMKKSGYSEEPQSISPIINSMTGEELKYSMSTSGDFVDYRNDTRQDVKPETDDVKTERFDDIQDTPTEQFGGYNQNPRFEQQSGHYVDDVQTEKFEDNYVSPVVQLQKNITPAPQQFAKENVNPASKPQVDLYDVETVYHDDLVQEDETPADAVVGWLVCVEGGDKGTHYTLKSGVNNMGRSLDMDVVVGRDVEVSRDRHAILVYDPDSREFFIEPGIGRGIAYLNDNMVLGSTKINERDCIRMGTTKLVFVSLCSKEFGWD